MAMLLGELLFIRVVATTLAAAPPSLPSEGPAVALRWEAPSGCEGHDADLLASRLAALMPDLELREAAPVDVMVDVELRALAHGFQVDVAVTSPLGVDRRSFAADTCQAAAEASALVIAVALDPVAVVAELERARASADVVVEAEPRPHTNPRHTNPPPSPAPLLELELEPSLNIQLDQLDGEASQPPGTRRPIGFGLGVLAGGGHGPVDAGSAALEARFAVLGPRYRWELAGAWLIPIAHDVGGGRRIGIDGWRVGSRGCGLPPLGRASRLSLPLCAGFEAGAVRGRARTSIANPQTATRPWVAVGLGPGLSWAPRPRLALGVELALVVPLVTAGFALDQQPVLVYSPVGVRALLGVEVRLP